MKKIVLFGFLFLFGIIHLTAQISTNESYVSAKNKGETLNGIDDVIFFKGMSSNAQLIYTNSTTTNFKWYRYLTNPSSKVLLFSENNVQSSSLDLAISSSGYSGNGDGCGYVLEFDGQTKYYWVFDLNNVSVAIESITVDTIGVDPCTNARVSVKFNKLEALTYYNSSGTKQSIPRKFSITYNTLEDGSAKQETVAKSDFIADWNVFNVTAPYVSTVFTITGDQFYSSFGSPVSLTSALFTAFAVTAQLKGEVEERIYKNEIDRTKGTLGGSAPLVVNFTSNANIPVAQYFSWYIIPKSDSANSIYYTDINLRYSFKDAGLYKVRMVVSNSVCTYKDSLEVTAIGSYIDVPNIFTPNGDGKDDEFRVAYKSIVKFEGVIYNRWGRKVFEWTDPGKGWDGRINGRMAVPGAYYYIIEAKGADINPKTNRPYTFKLKGDINLIRGK